MPGRFRYSRWDGTQHLDALDADEVLDALSDDLMSYGDLSSALQRLYRWGNDDMPGLEQLLRELRDRREQELARYDLDSTVDAIREQLQDVIDTERAGIDRRMQEAMGLMESLQQMDRLESQLERGSFRLDDVDRGLAEQMLGPEARQQLDRMRQMTEVLEKAGYVERRDRRLELTPRGMRRIGQGALREIFNQLKKSRIGQHRIAPSGQGVEAGDELKLYEFGDPFLMDMKETLFNSLERQGRGVPVQIEPPDFVVHRTEHSTQASTVLMIDMSRSMFLRGCFLAAKKVAIALDSLIRAQFPRDSLYVVGFSNHAVELKPQSLPGIALNDYVYGTNMQHGFQVARSLLARHRGNRQIIMVTDGEPTAHLDGGRVYFAYPPTYRTIQETLREVRRCTRDHIVINTFMLERGPYLTEFVNQVTRINKGRAFFVSPERLGEYVLVDYVSGKQRRQRSRAS